MTTNSQAQAPSQLDQALKQTDFGSFIVRNKGIAIGAVIGILIAIIGHGFYKQAEDKTNDGFNQAIFNFKEVTLSSYKDKKIKSDVLMTELNKVEAQIKDYAGLNLLYFGISDELVRQGENEQALSVLMKAKNVTDLYSSYFLATRKAVVLEDLNRFDEALAALEGLGDKSKKLLEGKVYIDMGRLQLKTGDKEKARSSFEYLQSKTVQDEFAKLAKFYLYQMDKDNSAKSVPAVEVK